LAVLLIVEPFASLELAFTTRVKVALAPAASFPIAVMLPVPPTAGLVAVKPAAGVNDTNVVPVGMASVNWTACASLGPASLTVMVYVRLVPAVTVLGPL